MEVDHFHVAIRLKPSACPSSCIEIKENSLSLYNITEYSYDKIFDTEASTSQVSDFVIETINKSFKGINSTVICYGEQGSGKTFTLFGDSYSPGVVSSAVAYIFNHNYKENYIYSCSMIAVMQDYLVDLLNENNNNYKLHIKKNSSNSIIIENLAEIIVEKEEDCYFMLKRGLKMKSVNKLKCDVIFQLNIEALKADKKGKLTSAKINFCDLNFTKDNYNLLSLNSVLTCLSNNVSVPYKDSPLTKILYDTLNKNSNAVLIGTISASDSSIQQSIETLSIANLVSNITTSPKKNEFPANKLYVLKKLQNDISKLKNIVRYKQGGKNLHDEVHVLKKETEKLKEILSEQSTVEEVEALIKQNKNLRLQLQNIVGRPVAGNDVELPDSVSVLQKALVATEDMIKKRKIYLSDQEMKSKLTSEGRCTICTLKIPCKHKSAVEQPISLSFSTINSQEKHTAKATSPFITELQPNKFKVRMRSVLGIREASKEPPVTDKFIAKTERKIKVLSQIESFREQKVLREIEKIEQQEKIEKEVMEKKVADESKRKVYFDKIKKKLEKYRLTRKKSQDYQIKPKKKLRIRPKSVVKIPNYSERKKSISEILRSQSKYFSRRSQSISTKLSQVANSVEVLKK